MDNVEMERAGAIALNRIFGGRPEMAGEIIGSFGSAYKPFLAGLSELRDRFGVLAPGLDEITAEALESAKTELDGLEKQGFRFVCITEDTYPAALKECRDAPPGLYCRCSSPLESVFNASPCISVVGTRDMSPYGKEWCERIVAALARSDVRPVIVSGLAIGVDICAQMTALTSGIPTIGVLPTGINEIYPRRHTVAAEKIEKFPGGALVTDFPPGAPTFAANFLKRNRIIAGMSLATILIESRVKGGGMMTARLASGYGRDVFVLPGRIDDLRSGGCNRLLREKVAEPLVSLESLFEDLGLGRFRKALGDNPEERVRRNFGGEAENLLQLVTLIKNNRGISIEELSRASGMPYSEVSAGCWSLECEGIIETDMLQRCTIKVKID